MFGLTIIKKEKLRRLALDYQTRCLEVKRLKEEINEIRNAMQKSVRKRDAYGRFITMNE